MKSKILILYFFILCGYAYGQAIQKYSDTVTISNVSGTETYDYYLKDSIKVKSGKYHFEGQMYSQGIENKSRDQQRVKVDGNFKDGVIDGKWTETFVGMSEGLPYKQVFQANLIKGIPTGQWVSTDTTKSKDGIKFSINSFTIKNGKIVGSTVYKNTYLNRWTNLTFDENGLINCCDEFVHGFYKQNYREDVDPNLGIYYHKDDNKVYIVWNKFYINIFDKESSYFPDYPDVFERFQTRFQVFLNFIGEGMPIENFTFKVGYNYATANDEEMDKFLNKWATTNKKNLSLAYSKLLSGMKSYENDDYVAARDFFIEAQKLCVDCNLKEVINKKLTETKKLIFE